MQRLMLTLVVVCLIVPALAVPVPISSLGPWDEGAAGSTHQFWDFTPGYIIASGAGYTADPEDVFNPQPNAVLATITPLDGQWDGKGAIIADRIFVSLEIPNIEQTNPYKEIWVDLGDLIATNVTVSAWGESGSTKFGYDIVQGQGEADFGVIIRPNPYVEKINFLVTSATGAQVVLDYIHVDTICIPEPSTLAMLGLGVSAITLLRKRSA